MIEIKEVTKNYPGFVLDLKDMNIPENTITGLVGTNGSGKTTTFKLMTGLIEPDAGSISILGQSAWDIPVSVKEQIGVVFSDSGFSASLTISDIRKILAAFFSSFDGELFDRLCKQMDLPQGKPVSQFSTGMNVRLKVIAAIAHNPKLLILDEPTTGLDVIARNKILELLQTYMEVPGRSILISSHIASDLESVCDDFYMIHDGQLALHETVDALQNEYGILVVSPDQFEKLDPQAVIAWKKAPGGYEILVRDRKFYEDNYPGIVVKKSGIDDLIVILEEGEKK